MPKTKTKIIRIARGKRSYRTTIKTKRSKASATLHLISTFCLIACELCLINYLQGINTQAEGETPQIAKFEATEQIVEDKPKEEDIVRTFTAYNAGDPYQTDMTPCIGAYGDNICHLLATGTNVCASNEYPRGTIVEVEGIGRCTVYDTMNKRYHDRLDWAFEAHQKQEAKKFGIKNLKIKIIK